MRAWGIDLRHAIRSLTLRRGSSLAVALVISLGAGLLTTVFAIADPYTTRSLPYSKPHELVVISVGSEGITADASVPTLNEWRADTRLFQSIATTRSGGSVPVDTPNGTFPFSLQFVTQDFFSVLGLRGPDPDRWATAPEPASIPIVLTPAGRSALPPAQASPGTVLRRENDSLLVVGELPADFVFPSPRLASLTDAVGLLPVSDQPVVNIAGWRRDGRMIGLGRSQFIARVQPGVTPRILEERLSTLLPSGRRLDVKVETLGTHMTAHLRPLAWGALAAGLLILLVCAGNVANLALVRTAYRLQEVSTRRALGATTVDILRLWIIEHAVLALASFVFAIVIVQFALVAISMVIPDAFVTLGAPSLRSRVATFAALAVVVVVGVSVSPVATLTFRPAALTPGAHRKNVLRFAFMAGQSALAIILAIGGGMLLHSYHRLHAQDTGYDRSSLAFTVKYPYQRGRDVQLLEQVEGSVERLLRIPGVRSVGATDSSVVEPSLSAASVVVAGETVTSSLSGVTPGFFEAAGMTVVQGRGFLTSDERSRPIVVNETFVRAYLGHAVSPLGQMVIVRNRHTEIVGVVRDVFDKALDVRPTPTIHELISSARGAPITYVAALHPTAPDPSAAFRRAIIDGDDRAMIGDVGTIGDRFSKSVRDRQFPTLVLTLFGVAGVGVCISGLIGVVAFVVTRRSREIAIRIALGAQPIDIRKLVLMEVASASVLGATVGLLVGRWGSTYLTHLVYGLEAGDWTTSVVAALIVLTIMLLSTIWPSQRAVALSPSEALRVE